MKPQPGLGKLDDQARLAAHPQHVGQGLIMRVQKHPPLGKIPPPHVPDNPRQRPVAAVKQAVVDEEIAKVRHKGGGPKEVPDADQTESHGKIKRFKWFDIGAAGTAAGPRRTTPPQIRDDGRTPQKSNIRHSPPVRRDSAGKIARRTPAASIGDQRFPVEQKRA